MSNPLQRGKDSRTRREEVRKHLQRARQHLRLYETMLSSVQDFIYLFDLEGRFMIKAVGNRGGGNPRIHSWEEPRSGTGSQFAG